MILILGDLHGDYFRLKEVYEHALLNDKINAIIQVGDWGINDYSKLNFTIDRLPIYWIDGNHEDFKKLRKDDFVPNKLLTETKEVYSNIFYVPRGTVLELDGRKIACLGGAASVDKAWRVPEKDWFIDENISQEQIENFHNYDAKDIDFMITHCPPQSIVQKHFDPNDLRMFGLPITWQDPNMDIVEQVWDWFGRPMLYCGHMHRPVTDGKCRILDVNEFVTV